MGLADHTLSLTKLHKCTHSYINTQAHLVQSQRGFSISLGVETDKSYTDAMHSPLWP